MSVSTDPFGTADGQLRSEDVKAKAAVLEVIDSGLTPSLKSIVMPLLDDTSLEMQVEIGWRSSGDLVEIGRRSSGYLVEI